MTLDKLKKLWPIAKRLHEARRDMAWGPVIGPTREKWPGFTSAYSHNPISYVDLALEQARAIEDLLK